MKNLYVACGVILVAGVGVFFFFGQKAEAPTVEIPEVVENGTDAPLTTVIAEGLEIPWDVAFLPNGNLLVTERTGHVLEIGKDSVKTEIPVESVKQGGEGGLLGLVLHPQFVQNRLVYLYMSAPGTSGQTTNRVVRYSYENGSLTQEKVIISGIPGALYHDGGRMEFGPPAACASGRADCMLYITTGDATDADIAQDMDSLGGKVLRLTAEGDIPSDNPFGTAVWSWGHRNPQGLAWDSAGRLWETEHGRSGIRSGLDEINFIEAGNNYGWPEIEGDETQAAMVSPVRHSGASDTWAPASLAYLNGSLFFGGLRGEALYEAVLNGTQVVELKEHFKGEFGRIRTVRVGPGNMLYLTTSNRDGRGSVNQGDDKIIRVNPALLD